LKNYFNLIINILDCFKGEKENYFLHEKSKLYKKCSKGCLKCSSEKECLKCDSKKGYYSLKIRNKTESANITIGIIIIYNF